MRFSLRATLCGSRCDVDKHCQAAAGAFRAKAACNSACCLYSAMPSCLTLKFPVESYILGSLCGTTRAENPMPHVKRPN